jgi:hypothetical protein
MGLALSRPPRHGRPARRTAATVRPRGGRGGAAAWGTPQAGADREAARAAIGTVRGALSHRMPLEVRPMPTRRPRAAVAALLVLPLLGGGCVVAPQPYPTYGYAAPDAGSGTAAGVAAGAVAGGLLGAAASGRRDRGVGAVGGAAAGALIGGLIGGAADRDRAEAASPGYDGYGYGAPGYGYAPAPYTSGYGYAPGYAYY